MLETEYDSAKLERLLAISNKEELMTALEDEEEIDNLVKALRKYYDKDHKNAAAMKDDISKLMAAVKPTGDEPKLKDILNG